MRSQKATHEENNFLLGKAPLDGVEEEQRKARRPTSTRQARCPEPSAHPWHSPVRCLWKLLLSCPSLWGRHRGGSAWFFHLNRRHGGRGQQSLPQGCSPCDESFHGLKEKVENPGNEPSGKRVHAYKMDLRENNKFQPATATGCTVPWGADSILNLHCA